MNLRKPTQPHVCDGRCVCEVHGSPFIYWPGGDDHACQNPDCKYAHGVNVVDHQVVTHVRLERTLAPLMEIVDFLRDRLDEDERLALGASPGPWCVNAECDEVLAVDGVAVADGFALSGRQLRATTEHIARHEPARVLREIEWNRHIVHAFHALATNPARLHDVALHMQYEIFRRIVCGIALSYVDHSDYREEWRP